MIELTAINLTLRWQMNNNDTLKRLNAMLKDINGENRPVKFTQGDTIITMSYDYMGRRFAKTVNGTTQLFVYDNYLQIAELNEDSQIVKSYIWDPTAGYASRPLVANLNNAICYYGHDANKNVVNLLSEGKWAQYVYSPFGAVTVSSGSLADVNPFQFSSEYFDHDLGLTYYNYRHYNPTDGRWLSRDPIEEKGGYNLYGMVKNSPHDRYDLYGLWSPEWGDFFENLLGAAIGGVGIIAGGTLTVVPEPTTITKIAGATIFVASVDLFITNVMNATQAFMGYDETERTCGTNTALESLVITSMNAAGAPGVGTGFVYVYAGVQVTSSCVMLRANYNALAKIHSQRHIVVHQRRTGYYIIDKVDGKIQSGWEVQLYKRKYYGWEKVLDNKANHYETFSNLVDIMYVPYDTITNPPKYPPVIIDPPLVDQPRVIY